MNKNQNSVTMSVRPLQRHIQDFFEKHLSVERNASPNTILAYRDGVKLFLQHVTEKLHARVDELDHSILEPEHVLSFLRWLDTERHCSPRTRNQRLAALKAFARYLASVAPEHLDRCRAIQQLRPAAFRKKQPSYLDIDEVKQLVNAASDSPRDRALLLLLYNTGARVQELVDIDVSDLRRDPVALITLRGKGRKERSCPLWDRTRAALREWLDVRGIVDGPLFLNRHGRRLSRSGVAYILSRLTRKAQLEPTHAATVSPHIMRHTTAMHLLQADVDITTIAAWLGHAQLDTTHDYLQISLRMKLDALDALTLPPSMRRAASDANPLLTWLASLGKKPNYALISSLNPAKIRASRDFST